MNALWFLLAGVIGCFLAVVGCFSVALKLDLLRFSAGPEGLFEASERMREDLRRELETLKDEWKRVKQDLRSIEARIDAKRGNVQTQLEEIRKREEAIQQREREAMEDVPPWELVDGAENASEESSPEGPGVDPRVVAFNLKRRR